MTLQGFWQEYEIVACCDVLYSVFDKKVKISEEHNGAKDQTRTEFLQNKYDKIKKKKLVRFYIYTLP